MSCCIQNIFNFCTMRACDAEGVKLAGVTAPVAGIYTLQLNFLGEILEVTAEFEEDDLLIFPSTGLNESFEYVGRIIDPTGETMLFTIDATEYDGLRFTTKQFFEL